MAATGRPPAPGPPTLDSENVSQGGHFRGQLQNETRPKACPRAPVPPSSSLLGSRFTVHRTPVSTAVHHFRRAVTGSTLPVRRCTLVVTASTLHSLSCPLHSRR